VNTTRVAFGGLAVDVTPGWADISDDIEGDDKPFTLAKPDGVGAFQFSPALYRGGALPSPSADGLLEMVRESGRARRLGEPLDEALLEGRLASAGASYHSGGDFVRVWYVSDGSNIALVTYVCECGHEQAELEECEQIVSTLQFLGTEAEA
jgi:hypothetical protein